LGASPKTVKRSGDVKRRHPDGVVEPVRQDRGPQRLEPVPQNDAGGLGQADWYSYDLLDALGRRSSRRIIRRYDVRRRLVPLFREECENAGTDRIRLRNGSDVVRVSDDADLDRGHQSLGGLDDNVWGVDPLVVSD
jgi:hypothetical protein